MPKATTKPVSTPVPATTDLTDAQAKQLAEQIIKLQASSGTQIMSSVGELLFVAVYGSNGPSVDTGRLHGCSRARRNIRTGRDTAQGLV